MTGNVLILNGPGLSDPGGFADQAGATVTLDELRRDCAAWCADSGLSMDFRQSDDREQLLQWISDDSGDFDGLIVNPGCAPDVATVDRAACFAAIAAVSLTPKPVIEVHLENIFRHGDSVVATPGERYGDIGFVCGFGKRGYSLALQSMARKFGPPATHREP